MDTKLLLTNEKILLESDDKSLVLTSHRIRHSVSEIGKGYFVSIMLEKISSIEYQSKSWISALLFGIIAIVAGITLERADPAFIIVGTVVGISCITLYFATKRQVVTISSDGGAKINTNIKGMKHEDVLAFINKIEHAKLQLNQSSGIVAQF